MPPTPDEPDGQYEISVFTTKCATCEDMTDAAQYVADEKPGTVHGALVLSRKAFEDQRLQLVPSEPVFGASKHTNVRNWPDDRVAQREIANKLGKASHPVRLESAIRPNSRDQTETAVT